MPTFRQKMQEMAADDLTLSFCGSGSLDLWYSGPWNGMASTGSGCGSHLGNGAACFNMNIVARAQNTL